jgi:uncharacterized protein YfaS (alpha-2-macroglobulin family)
VAHANSGEERRERIEQRKGAHRRTNGALVAVLLLVVPLGVVGAGVLRSGPRRFGSRVVDSLGSVLIGVVLGVLATIVLAGLLFVLAGLLHGAVLAIALLALVGFAAGVMILLARWEFGRSTPADFRRDLALLFAVYVAVVAAVVVFSSAIDFADVNQLLVADAALALLFPVGYIAAADEPKARLHRGVVIGLVLSLAVNPAVVGAFVLEIGDQQETAPTTSFDAAGGADAAAAGAGGGGGGASGDDGSDSVEVRQYFPETLASETVVTGANGTATLDLQLADSITTWRVSALASDRAGTIGSTQSSIEVFQSFFVKPDVPLTLTQRDRVTIPVSVFNYGNETRSVALTLRDGAWFEARNTTDSVTVPPNTVRQASFTITATENGEHPLTIVARGATAGAANGTRTDAVRKRVTVEPYGRERQVARSGTISGTERVPVSVPETAVDGSETTVLRVYPGAYGQTVGGLDALLSMPSGCFEQTSSSLYPNVLALQYMERTGQTNPEVRATAERYIATGYQRLLTFETSTEGGYSLFGNDPANLLLTAYGLQELSDMNRVYNVDPDVIAEMQGFITDRQRDDGSWSSDGRLEYPLGVAGDRLTTTAYVTWSLAKSDGQSRAVADGADYVRDNLDVESARTTTLAIALNALVAANRHDGLTQEIAAELDSRAIEGDEGEYWTRQGEDTAVRYGEKPVLTTALVTNAFLEGEYNLDRADSALDWLVAQKSGQGGWGSTQNTIMALQALTSAATGADETKTGTLTVTHDGEPVVERELTEQTADEVQTIVLPATTGENDYRIEGPTDSGLYYELSHTHHVPWEAAAAETTQSPIGMAVTHDRTNLTVDDTVETTVAVRSREGEVGMALVDLGVPPGFTVEAASLERLRAAGTISRYELRGRQVILYLEGVAGVREFSFRMRATKPIEATSGPGRVYDYYNPDTDAIEAPVTFHVRAG